MNLYINTKLELICPCGHFSHITVISLFVTAGAVIRMMQHFLTPEVFRDGLRIYIKKK